MSSPSPTTLDAILDCTRKRVAHSRESCNIRQLEKAAHLHSVRGFLKMLCAHSGPPIISELKKASPSRGIIRELFQPAVLAQQLTEAGAAALSVVTEPQFFRGSLDNLRQASMATHLPCLRKDFIIDEFQVIEARAYRADAVLLIMSVLTDRAFRNLANLAAELDLDVLCEVHNHDELKRAIDGGAQIIGVNSRNLHTLDVSHRHLEDMVRGMPLDAFRIAESGISKGATVRRLHDRGYDAFLIGEALMASDDPGLALRRLLREAALVQDVQEAQRNDSIACNH